VGQADWSAFVCMGRNSILSLWRLGYTCRAKGGVRMLVPCLVHLQASLTLCADTVTDCLLTGAETQKCAVEVYRASTDPICR
jgi:hypothetical protein